MTRRSGLGRGLDALLPAASEGLEAQSALQEIPTSAIDPNPRQPRTRFAEDELAELAASIRELGILQPLLVRPATAGRFELVAGERRWRAAQLADLVTVPALVTDTDARGSLERALVENLQRADLNPIEEASAYKQLIDEGGLTQEALGERLGRSRTTIAHALRLLDLPVGVQRWLVEGRLSAGHGKALLALDQSPFQERLARRVAQEGMSVRETEDLVRRYQAISGGGEPNGVTTSPRPERPAIVTEAQRRLADHLQTRVRVEIGKRKGKVVLDFVSLEELDRILQMILPREAPHD